MHILKLLPARMLCLTALLASAQAFAQAKPFPDRPLHFVVPFTAGGNADVVARTVGRGLSEQLKQSVVIDNKPGGNTIIGTESVARALPDGHTFLLATAESVAINPNIYKKISFDPFRDFSVVGVIGHFPFALVVNPKLPVQNLAEFIAYAKQNRGKLNYASWGIGSTAQIATEQFKRVAGIEMEHVPFQGAAPAITAVTAGQVDAFMVPLAVAVPQAKSGRVKLLGVTTAARVNESPDIPTLSEQGAAVVIGGWHMMVVPKATPADVVARLNAALNATINGREMRETLLKLGIDSANTTPAEAEKLLQVESQRWGRIARDAGVSVD